MARRTHGMQSDESFIGHQFDVMRAATADPAVVDADHGKTVLARFFDRRLRGLIHGHHADVVAAVEHR